MKWCYNVSFQFQLVMNRRFLKNNIKNVCESIVQSFLLKWVIGKLCKKCLLHMILWCPGITQLVNIKSKSIAIQSLWWFGVAHSREYCSDTITRKKKKRFTRKHEGLYLYCHGYCDDGDTWSAHCGVWTKWCCGHPNALVWMGLEHQKSCIGSDFSMPKVEKTVFFGKYCT